MTGQTCPSWALDMIAQLAQVEIYLGNIPSAKAWKSEQLKKVLERSIGTEHVFDDSHAELIFKRIVLALQAEGYSAADCVRFINAGVGYEGGPKYCNEDEVQEALKK